MHFPSLDVATRGSYGNTKRAFKAAKRDLPSGETVLCAVSMKNQAGGLDGAIVVGDQHIYVGFQTLAGLAGGGEWKPREDPHPLQAQGVPGGMGVTLGDFGTAVLVVALTDYGPLRSALGWPDEVPEGPAAAQESASDRLRAIRDLHADGLLTDDEYESKRARIVDEL